MWSINQVVGHEGVAIPDLIGNTELAQTKGITLNGRKYFFVGSDDRSISGKAGVSHNFHSFLLCRFPSFHHTRIDIHSLHSRTDVWSSKLIMLSSSLCTSFPPNIPNATGPPSWSQTLSSLLSQPNQTVFLDSALFVLGLDVWRDITTTSDELNWLYERIYEWIVAKCGDMLEKSDL
ncbi:hypothetical protein FRB91_004417 [Serendipita sp. 411]|nr:hypothetical protein FRC19_003589 [Serendipita sp. 401]KAG8842109.1 hypothetical protein FRB91_004417 [Serendipita sp. 411]